MLPVDEKILKEYTQKKYTQRKKEITTIKGNIYIYRVHLEQKLPNRKTSYNPTKIYWVEKKMLFRLLPIRKQVRY